jgi:tetratricopeptide (TPR) repeat protein
MKREARLFITVALLAAGLAIAQTNSNQSPAPQGPKAQAAGGAHAQPAAHEHRVLQAKSQEEMKAYQDAVAKTDPAAAAAAADEFSAKYPDSELKASLYIRVMSIYGQANNPDKVVEVGRKAIAADATNPVPLVQVAAVLAESTRETDLDREERLNEAAKDAQAAITNIDTGLVVPPNTPADKLASAKASILIMAYDSLGMVELEKKDYAGAEQQLLKAVDASRTAPDAAVYLRLSVAQDNLKKYQQALDSANKAVKFATPGSTAQNLAKQQRTRLQKLVAAQQPAGGAAPPATPAPATPAGATSPPPTPQH